MIRTILTVVPATQFKVGDVVAFNTQRWEDEVSVDSTGEYRFKIQKVNVEGKNIFIEGVVVWSKNCYFRVGSLAGPFEVKWYDLVPAFAVKPKRVRLEKFTVMSSHSGYYANVWAKNETNAKKNTMRKLKHCGEVFFVMNGHITPKNMRCQRAKLR